MYELNNEVESSSVVELQQLQTSIFSKMSQFSKFYNFLSQTGEGLKLVSFYISAQTALYAKSENDPHFPIEIGRIRDIYFDKTSFWCLPKGLLDDLDRTNTTG